MFRIDLKAAGVLLVIMVAAIAYLLPGALKNYEKQQLVKRLCDFTPEANVRAYEDFKSITLYDTCLGASYDFIEEDYLDRWYALNLRAGIPGHTVSELVDSGLCPDQDFVSTAFNVSLADLFMIPVILKACGYNDELAELARETAPKEVNSYGEALSFLMLGRQNRVEGYYTHQNVENSVLLELFSKACNFEGSFEEPCEAYYKVIIDTSTVCNNEFDRNAIMEVIVKAADSPSPNDKGCALAALNLLGQ